MMFTFYQSNFPLVADFTLHLSRSPALLLSNVTMQIDLPNYDKKLTLRLYSQRKGQDAVSMISFDVPTTDQAIADSRQNPLSKILIERTTSKFNQTLLLRHAEQEDIGKYWLEAIVDIKSDFTYKSNVVNQDVRGESEDILDLGQ